MPSFDTVCEADQVEVKNAVENSAKEIATRFDFKGTSAAIEIKDKEITLFGDAEFQLAVDKALARLYRSGDVNEIYRRWFGALGEPTPLLKAMFVLQSLPE